MDLKDLITIDKGVTFILSCLVIYFLYLLIKNLPEWIEKFAKILQDNAVITDNNTEAMHQVKTVIDKTEGMHKVMDVRIKNIEDTITEIRQMVATLVDNEDDIKNCLNKKIEKLESEINALRNSKR